MGAKGIGRQTQFSILKGLTGRGVYTARREAIRKSQAAMQYLRESAMIEARQEVRLLLIDIIYAKQRIAATEKICDGLLLFRKRSERLSMRAMRQNSTIISL